MIVKREDPTFIFFFVIALVIQNEQTIRKSEFAKLPEIMTNLRVVNSAQLDLLWEKAETLEQATPHSFKCLPEVLAIFTKNAPGLKEGCTRLEQLSCLPLVPAEMLFYAFHGEIECANPMCA